MICLISRAALSVLAIEAKQHSSEIQEQIGIFRSSPAIPTSRANIMRRSPVGSPAVLTGMTYGTISAGRLGSPDTFIATGIFVPI